MIDNDGYVIIDNKKDPKSKKVIFFKIFLFVYIFFIVTALVTSRKKQDPIDLQTSLIDYYDVRGEMIRYAKNVNRFFLFYDGYDTGKYRLNSVDSKANYNEIKNYLENESDFIYYLTDYSKERVYTNFDNYKYKSFSLNETDESISFYSYDYIRTELDSYFFNEEFNGKPINEAFEDRNIRGHILLPVYYTEQYRSTQLNNAVRSVSDQNSMIYSINNLFFASMAILVLMTLIGLFNIKNLINAYNSYYDDYCKIPNLIKFILFCIIAFMILVLKNVYTTQLMDIDIEFFLGIFFLASLILLALINNKYYFVFVKDKKLKSKLFDRIRSDFKVINSSNNILDIALFYLGIFSVLVATYYLILAIRYEFLPAVILYSIGLLAYMYYYNFIVSFYRLKQTIKNIYNNNPTDEQYNPKKIKDSVFYLNNLETNLVQSIDKMVKSERLKAELITNVSHDLKTPLTSIINYVELLKKEGLNSNNASDYLNVLEQKSNRLKFLIEDLFEASKLATGNIALEISKINVVDLMEQAIGELAEKFMEKNIDLKFKYSNKDIYLDMDGKKIWRVFDNLLSNILKYSMPNSRAYININDDNNKVTIIFRNTSNYEIPLDSKDFFERFKRGDESRNTEGNGLGLSIAQSIILLHKGEIDIIVDGDLFKVIIVFNKIS